MDGTQVRCLLRAYKNAKGEPQMEICLHGDRVRVLLYAFWKTKDQLWRTNIVQEELDKVFDELMTGKLIAFAEPKNERPKS
jgi:hypothetical protein